MKIRQIEQSQVYWLMELLAKKIEERFTKVSDACIYFATYAAEHQGYKAK
jgi:hypothetical protein